jgi:hypothetical protein
MLLSFIGLEERISSDKITNIDWNPWFTTLLLTQHIRINMHNIA